jgi:hypothetical protein
MSIELSPDKFEIRDDATDGLVVNHATKLIPIVQKASATNIDLVFPDVSKGTASIMRTGTDDDYTPARGYRSYAWGLRIDAGIQQGSINLAAIGAGLAPNFLLGNVRAFRSVNPREDVFGPFVKSFLENTWVPAKGGRLESTAWCRRIFWFDIAGGFVRLNWKQSTAAYSPNALDPNIVFFPDNLRTLRRPPAYQIGSSYRTNSGSGPLDPPVNHPPSELDPPLWSSGPLGSFSFGSTWRFSNINIWLGQL